VNRQSIYRFLLIIILLVGLSLSCNLVTDIKETFEMKNTAEAFITDIDIEGLATEFDFEAIATEFDFEAIETEIDALATEFDFDVIETEFGMGELFETSEFQIPGFVGERPADIPVMPEAADIMESADFVEYSVDVDINQVKNFYEQEMPKNGWTKTKEDIGEGYASITYTKGGRTATLDITDLFGILVTISIEGN